MILIGIAIIGIPLFVYASPLENQSENLNTNEDTISNSAHTKYNLEGNWTAEWHTDSAILKDKVTIRQANDQIITEYAKSPPYPDCADNQILPGDLYFDGNIVGDTKIEGSSWACQSGIETSIPLTLEIQDQGNKMEGIWKDNQDNENKFVFTRDSINSN